MGSVGVEWAWPWGRGGGGAGGVSEPSPLDTRC